ncbi:hypothetical protein GBK02_15720 [Dechloromonas sp. TW-R-39-2]|uniref:hypothetical protein n=1 Tax=Dechloromonas sp. TW-R-39-2 TaxID=2654218 RepID=UPI00193E29B4|nr:hypothetical protein [Dechloromonas sp. TW-R-39-2]QRM20722.1 hypothetical protein GBK02_15720 [Dechloromonas sp. TW-R-39-2]
MSRKSGAVGNSNSQKVKDLPALANQKIKVGQPSKFVHFVRLSKLLGAVAMVERLREQSKFNKGGNFAFMWALDAANSSNWDAAAFSKFPKKEFDTSNAMLMLSPGIPESRCHCTEFQLLNGLEKTQSDSYKRVNAVAIYTERFPCKSCTALLLNYKGLRPDLAICIYHTEEEHMQHAIALQQAKITLRRVPRLSDALRFEPKVGSDYVFAHGNTLEKFTFMGPSAPDLSEWRDQQGKMMGDLLNDACYLLVGDATGQPVPGTLAYLTAHFSTT